MAEPLRVVPAPDPTGKPSQAHAAAPGDYARATELFSAGLVAQARAALAACVTEAPGHVGSRFGLAVCDERLGDDASAEAGYRFTLLLDPAHENAKAHLARLLERTARVDQVAGAPAAAPVQTPVGAAPAAPVETSMPTRAVPATLADDLDSGERARSAAGAVLHEGHRAVLAHRRLWVGLLLLLLLPALGVSTQRVTRWAPPELRDGPLGVGVEELVSAAYYLQFAILAASALLVASALLNAVCTRYVVRERRIDVHQGILFRSRRPVWLYDVNDIEYSQSPVQMLARTATLTLHMDEQDERRRAVAVRDLRSGAFLRDLLEELQPAILRERRAMKKQFV